MDPTFFEELAQKLGGSDAEFSQAYVIAHEIGHHVQNLTGASDEARRLGAQGAESVLHPVPPRPGAWWLAQHRGAERRVAQQLAAQLTQVRPQVFRFTGSVT